MAHQTSEKDAAIATHTEDASSNSSGNGNLHVIDQTVSSSALPKGYWTSRFFVGSSIAMALSLLSTVSAFGYAAPVLGLINADIGPDDNYIWVSLVYTVSLSVSLVIVGRITDIFGRRYFVISFTGLGVVGSIVCATANTIPVLIGGNVLLGLSTAAGMSFPFLMGELVPIRYRYAASAALYVMLLPGSGFGPMISDAMIKNHPEVGWRGVYAGLHSDQQNNNIANICTAFKILHSPRIRSACPGLLGECERHQK
jgi:hypothetical protein